MIRSVRWVLVLWRVLLAAVLLVAIYPIGSSTMRLFIIGGSAVLWVGVLFFVRRNHWLLSLALAVVAIPGIFLLLPARAVDAGKLRAAYLENLRSYEGTKYLWGGENHLGIDCSGLVRQALIDANVEMGLKTLNPELLRRAISMSWRDCSALALRNEYQDFTKKRGRLKSINGADVSQLTPGNIAVTANGIHVLAYLGGSQWIQADPEAGRVVTVSAPDEQGWFDSPMILMEWRQLGD